MKSRKSPLIIIIILTIFVNKFSSITISLKKKNNDKFHIDKLLSEITKENNDNDNDSNNNNIDKELKSYLRKFKALNVYSNSNKKNAKKIKHNKPKVIIINKPKNIKKIGKTKTSKNKNMKNYFLKYDPIGIRRIHFSNLPKSFKN